MEDRFEVRAWNNRTKEYVNEKGINTIYKGVYNATMLLGLFQYLKDNKQIQVIAKDFVFEQCTGLKDKNGKLIYEGDIIKSYINDCDYVVKREKHFACFSYVRVDKNIGTPLSEGDITNYELKIVGNIHENPDLLKEKES